jgi:hypothetical protein
MPLDDTWWDPAGPFGDNAEGAITATTMRQFAQAIADHGVTGSWFNIMFTTTAITPSQWTTDDLVKVLWLKKATEFEHSADWTYATDTALNDTFTYTETGDVTLQVAFAPAAINVVNARPNTTMTPVLSVTSSALVLPDDTNTFVIGPTLPITLDNQDLDISGWASMIMGSADRTVRFGLRFDPPSGHAIDDGGLNFNVDPTGAGASVVARPLAPSV